MRRDIELAKRLLESKGYKISRLYESGNTSDDPLYSAIMDLGIGYDSIDLDDDGTWYVSREEPYTQEDLDRIWFKLLNATGAGFEDDMNTMWFTFD